MFGNTNRFAKSLMLIASGALMLQVAGCDVAAAIQTGLLGVIAGGVVFLARNV